MAAKNRAELDSSINTKIVQTVTNSIDRGVRKEFSESAVLKKHTVTSALWIATLDFSSTDTFTVNLAGIISQAEFTISNLEIGQTGYIVFSGTPGALSSSERYISFTNATFQRKNRSAALLSQISGRVIKVTNFNGTYIAEYVGNDLFGNTTSYDFEDMYGMDLDIQVGAFTTPVNGPTTGIAGNAILAGHLMVKTYSTQTWFKLFTSGTATDGEIYLGYMTNSLSLTWKKVTSA